MNIGKRIKEIRQKYELSQKEFARKLNEIRQTVSFIENDDRLPSSKMIIKIAEEFNVNPSWLLLGKGSMLLSESESTEELLTKIKVLEKEVQVLREILEMKKKED